MTDSSLTISWIISFLFMGAAQLATFAYFMGSMNSKLAKAALLADDTKVVVETIRIAMATASEQNRAVTIQVGDLEIRVRKLEAA